MKEKFQSLVKLTWAIDVAAIWIWEVIKFPMSLIWNMLVALVLCITETSLKNAVYYVVKAWIIRMKRKIQLTKRELNTKVEQTIYEER